MGKFIDRSGQKIEHWNIIEPTNQRKNGKRMWKCLCDCQLDKPESERDYCVMDISNILGGTSKSCGCYKVEQLLNNKHSKCFNQYELHRDGYIVGTIKNGYQFYIDQDDLELVKPYSWHQHKDGYLRTCTGYYQDETGKRHNKYILMHKLIASTHGFNESLEVDHVNGIPYDNRKENLRSVTHMQNMQNVKMYSTNKSGYKGVYCENQKWKANIRVNKKQIFLGTFDTFEAAVQARKNAETQYYGDYLRDPNNLYNGTSHANNEGSEA